MSKRRPIILSSEDRRILKALDPFALLKPVTFAPTNMVCGYKNLKLAWMFHTDASVDLEIDEPFDMSYQMALIQNFDICDATQHAREISTLMKRIVYPDLDIEVLGKWYVPKRSGLLKSDVKWVMFGTTGAFRMDNAPEEKGLDWPVVEAPDGSRLLVANREHLSEVINWFHVNSPGQPQIMWLGIPGFDEPMCHVRGVMESVDHTQMTTVYFLLSGAVDNDGTGLEKWVGLL